MMMHRLYFALLTLFAFVACSKVPATGDRWGEGPTPPPPKPDTEENISPSHRVLIEKYTGQECVNCPTAAALLEGLETAHPDRLVVVSMHAAHTGQTLPELRSDVADSYAKKFRIPRSIPGIMLDRRPLAGGERYSTSSAQWTSEILRALKVYTPLSLALQVTPAEQKDAWTWRVDLTPTSKAQLTASDYLLTLWAVEDVLAPQQGASGLIPNFKHHNVLRAELLQTDVTPGTPFSRTLPVPSEVKDRTKAKLIAFVTDAKTGYVLDAQLVPAPLSTPSLPEKPEEPSKGKPETPVDDPTFADPDTGQPLATGSVLTCSPVHPLEIREGIAEVVSPYVKLLLPKGAPATYQVEVKATSAGVGKGTHGLHGVCLTSCTTLDVLAPTFRLLDYHPQSTDLIGVHYGLSSAFAHKEGTYEARLSLKQAGKVVTSLIYRFVIDRKNFPKEEPKPAKPQPPTPTPVPKPDPQPTPTPPADKSDIPEAKKTHAVAFDFTGQRCPACPWMLGHMEYLKKTFGEDFHPVAIQSSSYRAGAELFSEDYWMYHIFYRPPHYPSVFLANTKEQIDQQNIPNLLREFIQKKPSVKLRLRLTNTPTHVTVHFKALPNDGMTPPQDVQVLFLLVQSNMIAYQVNRSDSYSHQHVLRRGLNNQMIDEDWQRWTWGDKYSLGKEFSATYKLEDARRTGSLPIVPKDCEVIALLLDAKTKRVLNATSASLK